ncbi:ASCH domain-containing protein [Rathayibacter sp. SD072]|uniref:ASCH domain-containing protein n=1 Tax=Rathayibacter sp. SD072 TaxID=2781731 RepID=UPI001A963F8C|nr:ASCH domain-containing protein [Rathayibacter sp. SD072]
MSDEPEVSSVPARLDLPSGGFLRPLVSSDAELLRGVIGERRAWLAALLPEGSEAAEPEDDVRALRSLESAARDGRVHAFLLVDETWTTAIGALSVVPGPGRTASASWWVVPELRGSRVEEELDAFTRRWLLTRWPFDEVETPDNHPEDPAALAGANLLAVLPDEPERTPLPEPDLEAARRLWSEYPGSGPSPLPPVESFGDSVQLADELLELVRRGVKTATASLVGQEPVPAAGDHWIVCDGAGVPRLVLRSDEVRVAPLDSVDDVFAWAEGEGDRSRESWLQGHRRYFAREDPESPLDRVVFERFRVVWPQGDADRAAAFLRSPAATSPDRRPPG